MKFSPWPTQATIQVAFVLHMKLCKHADAHKIFDTTKPPSPNFLICWVELQPLRWGDNGSNKSCATSGFRRLTFEIQVVKSVASKLTDIRISPGNVCSGGLLLGFAILSGMKPLQVMVVKQETSQSNSPGDAYFSRRGSWLQMLESFWAMLVFLARPPMQPTVWCSADPLGWLWQEERSRWRHGHSYLSLRYRALHCLVARKRSTTKLFWVFLWGGGASQTIQDLISPDRGSTYVPGKPSCLETNQSALKSTNHL